MLKLKLVSSIIQHQCWILHSTSPTARSWKYSIPIAGHTCRWRLSEHSDRDKTFFSCVNFQQGKSNYTVYAKEANLATLCGCLCKIDGEILQNWHIRPRAMHRNWTIYNQSQFYRCKLNIGLLDLERSEQGIKCSLTQLDPTLSLCHIFNSLKLHFLIHL